MSKINKIKLSGTTYDIQDLSATSVVNVTQAEYDALVTGGTVDPTTLYNITDAQGGDLTNYYTKTETNSAITEAVNGKADSSAVTQEISAAVGGKQDTLVSGTNIKTINNESILGSGNIDIQGGGGGKAISAGTNISVTTGETADTINCTLPITAGTGNMSVIMGNSSNIASITSALSLGTVTKAKGQGSAAFGERTETTSNAPYSFTCGGHTITRNWYEFAGGKFNVSNSGSTSSAQTLFSVGNGTASNARHNAFEIRQNGDIYITSGGTDIKLQDNLGSGGGGGSSYTAGDGIDITNNVISVSGVVMSSAITTSISSTSTDAQVPSAKAVNDKLGGLSLVKLTQAEYDALATKDNSTLYVIVN